MTTLRDLLNDFADDIIAIDPTSLPLGGTPADMQDAKEEIIDEYIETIKERIIG